MVIAVIAVAVMAGAMAQRVSGMGFAIIVAPVLVLVVGPVDGILMVNICGAVSASIIFTQVWRDVDWRQYFLLTVPALVALAPGVWIAVRLGGPMLQVGVGVLLLSVLTLSLFATRGERVLPTVPAAVLSGGACGFLSATAGASGPSVSIYAVVTRWDQRSFAATIQPFFATLGTIAFVSKVRSLPEGLPAYPWWLWLLIMSCTLVGLTVGGYLSQIVSVRLARISVIVLAYPGAIITVVDGAMQLGL